MSLHSKARITKSGPETGSEEREVPQTRFLLWLAAILAVAGAAYIDLAWSDPIFQRAEDYFAESAREMLSLSQYVTPILYGKVFFDKPILTYWAIQASIALGGASHLAARLPSILAALATAALTAFSVARVWGRREGLAAAAVLCSCYGVFYFATLSMSDMFLTFFCTATAAWLFVGNLGAERRTWDWGIAAIFCALAVLTKGPVGVVLPVAAFLLYLAIRGELRQVRLRHLLVGFAALALLAGSWFVLLWRQNGNPALRAFFIGENLKRFTGSMYGTHRAFGYTPLTLLLNFIPWTIVLPFAVVRSVKNWRADRDSPSSRGELFLWCYIATIVAFFWVARTQLDYYVLPAMPACAALVGIYLGREAESSRVLQGSTWVIAGMLVVGSAVAGCWLVFSEESYLQMLWPLLLWIFLSGAAMTFLLAHRRYNAVLAVILLAIFGGSTIALRVVNPIYLRAYPLGDLARAVQDREEGKPPGSLPLGMSGDLEHWRSEMAFQTARVPALLDTPQEMADFLRSPGPRLVLVTDEWLGKLPPDQAGHVQIVYQTPILLDGLPLSTFLDSARLQSRMKIVSWVFVDAGSSINAGTSSGDADNK